MDTKALDPQQIAEQVRDTMFANDQASRGLGMTFVEVGPGRATLTMTVRADMLNGFAIIHGGFVTTLADSAFAFACNSYNEQTVASGISVDFIAPAREGDVLTATAREVALSGRTGVYDITVTNQHGATIAVMRGKSYRLKGRAVFPQ
ncbi:hydroxyphenylacetyl-CoA thioesterase PaaI [Denitromonas halophila]|uniref:Hydroxyphenylacetyl-CoA thioesterase PaaI n=1 Tax=Denitromonas halophila TaxID=1629404 RepID=A0A557R0A7_9RHOO|nr:hydroxyphenylacetyl-CoA thioesterase PaaI [Denitromonas halophila]TVO58574.1 hydroxyphenylacetyl-CoA thioesterase PaaI [Denitromonas halophila]